MNKENTMKLIKDFPELYKGVYMSFMENLMPFGFECGNGWFKLIYALSKSIYEYDKTVFAMQVKEKFGTLRFYISGGDDQIYDIIEEAEHLSGIICEECGNTGFLSGRGGWVKTLCQNCIDTVPHLSEYKKLEDDPDDLDEPVSESKYKTMDGPVKAILNDI